MATRALQISTVQPRNLRLIMSIDQDDRDTLPPSPATEPPPALSIKPSDTLTRMPGYDDNQFLHVALAAAADAAHEIRESRRTTDIAALLEKQTERILRETSADIGLIRSSIGGLQQSVDALVTRVGNTEREVFANRTATSEQFEKLELDMAAMRYQLDRIDREVAILKAVKEAIGTAPPPPTE